MYSACKVLDLFDSNGSTKFLKIEILLKPGRYTVKQKTRTIPIDLQVKVRRELGKKAKGWTFRKTNTVDEDCFVSPFVVNVK